MKNLKRFLCTLLCIAMCAGMVIPTAATATVPTGIESVDDLLASIGAENYHKIDFGTDYNTVWGMAAQYLDNEWTKPYYSAHQLNIEYEGEQCVKLKYTGIPEGKEITAFDWFAGSAGMGESAQSRYILSFSQKTKGANNIPTDHTYLVVTYATESTNANQIGIYPGAAGTAVVEDNTSVSEGKWACSDVYSVQAGFISRYNSTGNNNVAIWFTETANNAEFYLESAIFFADAADAATYAELAPILMDPNYVPEEPEEPEESEPSVPTDAVVTFEVETDATYYNVGDTIEATIVATASEDINVYSVNFELDVPADLEMVEDSFMATTATEGADIKGEKFAWAYNGEDNQLEITTDGVEVATVEFTIVENPDEKAKISVTPEKVGLNNGKDEATAAAEPLNVPLYDIEITVIGENTTLAEGVDLFARYDEAELYTDEARTAEYDLATELEALGGYAITGYEFDNGEGAEEIDLDTFTFKESGTLTAITVAEVTVTIEAGENGTVNGYTDALVELPAQTLGDILTNNNIDVDPDENYEFVGWYDADDKKVEVTDEINANITIHPVFEGVDVNVTSAYLNFFKDTETIENADTIEVTVAKFANNLQVTVEPITGYFLEKVTYTQGETETEMAAQSGNVYASLATLGSVEPITVTAYYSKLVTVEFTAKADVAEFADGAQLVFYAKQYEGKLYIDEACEIEATEANIPTFNYLTNEEEGYMSVAMAGEEAWLIGDDDYANAGLLTFVYTDDKTEIIPNSDTEYRLTFTYTAGGVITGLNGATDNVVVWAKKDTAMTDIAVPTINTVNDDQYETEFTGLPTAVEGAATYTAVATPKSYDVTLENTDGKLEIDVTEGTYSQDLEVTISIKAEAENTGYIVPEKVTYKVGDGEPAELDVVDGKFTIPGANITDDITVTAEAIKDTFELTVPAGVIVNNTAAEGTVEYQVGDTVTVEVADGTLVSGITYTVDGVEGTNVAAYADGKYTLDPTKLVGNVTITVTTLNVTFEYISADDYKALKADTQILLVKGADENKVVALADENIKVFWSSKYNAHVAIVSATASDNDLANGMTVVDGTPDAIAYEGDVNDSGATLAADAAYVSYMLHQSVLADGADFTDIERLEADFNGDGTVSTNDCQAILNVYLNAQQGN